MGHNDFIMRMPLCNAMFNNLDEGFLEQRARQKKWNCIGLDGIRRSAHVTRAQLGNFHSTPPTGGVESTSRNSVLLFVRHHFNIFNKDPSNHPRTKSDPTYYTSLERGGRQPMSKEINYYYYYISHDDDNDSKALCALCNIRVQCICALCSLHCKVCNF